MEKRKKRRRRLLLFILIILIICAILYFWKNGVPDFLKETESSPTSSQSQSADEGKQLGYEAVLEPVADLNKITDTQLKRAQSVINSRLDKMDIERYETDVDNTKKTITVRVYINSRQTFGPSDFKKLAKMGWFVICKGTTFDMDNAIVDSQHVISATAESRDDTPCVVIRLNDDGKAKFADATQAMIGEKLAICLDEEVCSAPVVASAITDGVVVISGLADYDASTELAEQIGNDPLPFKLKVDESKIKNLISNKEDKGQ